MSARKYDELHRELLARYWCGDNGALDELCRQFTPLCRKLAIEKFRHRHEIEDLVQEGLIGVVIAAGRFDPSRGIFFVHYAAYWIIQQMSEGVCHRGMNLVHVPLHVLRQRRKARPADMPEKLRRRLEAADRAIELSQADTGELLSELGDRRTEMAPVLDDRLELLDEAIASLCSKERRIVKQHYGLGGKKPQSLSQIGAKLGLCRERIRQLKDEALGHIGEWIDYTMSQRRP